MSLGRLRSALYKAARLVGDAQAVEKHGVGERVERRLVDRPTGRLLGRLFR